MTNSPYAVLMAAEAPKYRQIADDLRVRIRSGEFAPSAQVPSKADLMRDHRVSLNTINDAMKVLISEGLIRTVQGLGTFVCDPLPEGQPLSEYEILTQALDALTGEVRQLRERVEAIEQRQAEESG
jgi:DNA-binding GntR family transcriptional regulator